jgi:hypothetical protein
MADSNARAALWLVLSKIDLELAAQARAKGCGCGGTLHRAAYPRKARGVDEPSERESFCCGVQGCRKRTTPASVRFLGRRVYAGFIVVLLSALRHGLSAPRCERLREHLGVDRRTVERWRQWWMETFVASRAWRTQRGRFVPPPQEAMLPWSLWERFAQEGRCRVVELLRFLAAWSTREEVAG